MDQETLTPCLEQATETESILIQKALKGDRQAFGKLYKMHYTQIYSIVKQPRVRSDEIEDLVQMTFVKAFEALDQFRQQSAFATWLTRIAINTCISHFRAMTSRHKLIVGAEDPEELRRSGSGVMDFEDPRDKMRKKARLMLVRERIRTLPEHYRQLMWLRYVKDWSYDEIVQELKMPVGTAKIRMFRARNLLERELVKRKYQGVLNGYGSFSLESAFF